MASATATVVSSTEFAGQKKLVTLTIPIGTADDTTTLTTALHGITSLDSIVGIAITGGNAYSIMKVVPSIVSASAMTINLLTYNFAGNAATTFTNATIALSVLGNA